MRLSKRLLQGSRLLVGLAVFGVVAYVAMRLLAKFWPYIALAVAVTYLVMLIVTFTAILLYVWVGLPAELDVHAPLCDEKRETVPEHVHAEATR